MCNPHAGAVHPNESLKLVLVHARPHNACCPPIPAPRGRRFRTQRGLYNRRALFAPCNTQLHPLADVCHGEAAKERAAAHRSRQQPRHLPTADTRRAADLPWCQRVSRYVCIPWWRHRGCRSAGGAGGACGRTAPGGAPETRSQRCEAHSAHSQPSERKGLLWRPRAVVHLLCTHGPCLSARGQAQATRPGFRSYGDALETPIYAPTYCRAHTATAAPASLLVACQRARGSPGCP